MPSSHCNHNYPGIAELEAEAIYVLRECAAVYDRAAILFSGGKDSIVVAHLAKLAFQPAPIPFSLLHIDTGHNFPEALEFRDDLAEKLGCSLEVRFVQDSIDAGRVAEETGEFRSRNTLQTVTLLDAIRELNLDAAIGGARRDEEKSRAKERFFSHRNSFGQWDPRLQRPEVWNLFNSRKQVGEHMRVFPISNWTELDVWRYIDLRNIEVPPLYFTHRRDVFRRNGVWLADSVHNNRRDDERVENRQIRFRTVGDVTCTGAIDSTASCTKEVLEELMGFNLTERSTRADDRRSDSAMEDRKRWGYF